ncbi:SAM-dependent methyltransferase [Membranicola marinus]|uniref:SAM-dependent methyltransferase n=1 Tax=Membranihabitans marinus TaxID=1227546 RepID=A0A953HX82_9BACT|nr:methyltransferase domain-containing protein [Membranihabitans marinus]MBY5960155.1 SAM-dependent methyltransferase [Membranihabitans marinus]
MLHKDYWNERWMENNTGWDIGQASPPLMEYLQQIPNRDIEILIPGSGSGYEAEQAYRMGFHRVHYNDIAPEAKIRFQKRVPDFPAEQIIMQDIFKLNGRYDLILEQTSFCAQPPERRNEYISKIHDLLNPNGKYAGVLFDVEFPGDGPPFGGNREEYARLFGKKFKILKMEKCYNSINPRQGKELFVILTPI